MLIASRVNGKYELGTSIVMPITKEEYDKYKETCRERLHHDDHGYIIISTDSGFSEESITEIKDRVKEYLDKESNDNKISIKDEKEKDTKNI